MDLFTNNNNKHIYLRGLDLHSLAIQYGTPLYIYDFESVKNKIGRLKRCLSDGLDIYFAVKANPNIKILKKMRALVDGLDISSAGEFRQVLKAGFSPKQLSFAGPGKTDDELKTIISENIGIINVESINEIKRVDSIAYSLRKKANISIRVNPKKQHNKFAIRMGGWPSQFGIDEEKCREVFQFIRRIEHCKLLGIHVYTGTQCLDEDTLIDNINNVLRMTIELFETTGYEPQIINFGGGFGVPYYKNQEEIDLDYVCSEISRKFIVFKRETGLAEVRGILELGRYLIAEAGMYITSVVDKKESRGKKYCVLNGGMNHHLAASGNFGQIVRKNFKIINLSNARNENKETITFVGPICTTIDVIGEQIEISEPEIGDCIAVLNSGAYGYTVSPLFFLSHDTPIELLIEGEHVTVIRKRFTSDVLNG